MGNFGRYVCVALPFLLTLAALISLLVGGLAGVAGNKEALYMFRVNTTGLSVKPTDLRSLVGARDVPHGLASDAAVVARQSSDLTNLTAADVGLNKVYDVNLWGFCYEPQSGSRQCLQPKFNWAETEINDTMTRLKTMASALGRNITIPSHINEALNLYSTVSRWTQVVFIIAYIALGVELVLGIVANCSRVASCLTWIVAGVASSATLAAAALATATAVVVIGAVESTAKWYGVNASFNVNFLVAIWLAVAFALAAGFFWFFTVCCCKPDHTRKRRHVDAEKTVPTGAYAPIHDPQNNPGYYHHQQTSYGGAAGHAQPRSDMAYEPYSHNR